MIWHSAFLAKKMFLSFFGPKTLFCQKAVTKSLWKQKFISRLQSLVWPMRHINHVRYFNNIKDESAIRSTLTLLCHVCFSKSACVISDVYKHSKYQPAVRADIKINQNVFVIQSAILASQNYNEVFCNHNRFNGCVRRDKLCI